MALNAYITQVQDLLHDAGASFYSVAAITRWINAARLKVAQKGQCIRVLPPSGAAQNQTVALQEVYPFSAVNPFVQLTPGVSNILGVKQVAVSWGSMKPALGYSPWRLFNAYFRAANVGPGNLPVRWSQYGQGENGSIYLYQIPSSALPMDWDCICEPLALAADADPEAIPAPFTDAVQYYATYLAFLGAQRSQDAEEMHNRFERSLFLARATSQADVISEYYNPARY